MSKELLKGAPPPPENFAETLPVVQRHFRAGHLACSDSGPGIKKAFRSVKDVPHLRVLHKRKNFAHLVKMPMKYLCKKLQKRVAKLDTTTKRIYRVKAGGNSAEGTFSVLKRNLTRMNLKGRSKRATLNVLSAAWLTKNAGLEGVAKAIRIYQSGILDTTPPADAFKSTSWLTTLEDLPVL